MLHYSQHFVFRLFSQQAVGSWQAGSVLTVVFICGDTAASVERQDNVTRQRHFHKVSKQTESAFNEGRQFEFKEAIAASTFWFFTVFKWLFGFQMKARIQKVNLQNGESLAKSCAVCVLCSFQMCRVGAGSGLSPFACWETSGERMGRSTSSHCESSECQRPPQSPVKTSRAPATWYTLALPQRLLSALRHHALFGAGLHVFNTWVVPLAH